MARIDIDTKKSGTTSRAAADFAATLTTAQASIARKGFQAMLPNGKTVATRDMPRQNNDFIRPLAGGALAFRAPVHGKTSPNSPFTRSELRETHANGKERNWKMSDGTHGLGGTLAVTRVPSSGRVVFGQIHAKNTTKPMVKLLFEAGDGPKGQIIAELRKTPEGPISRVLLKKGVGLGEQFSYAMLLGASGRLEMFTGSKADGGTSQAIPVAQGWNGYDLYFKAGAYGLDKTGRNEASEVIYSRLSSRHP